LEIRVADSILEIPRDQWNRCFPGALEDWDYLKVAEQAGMQGFRYFYPALWQGETLLAAVPAFVTDYRLDTTVTGRWKRLTERLAELAPRLLTLRMACLGSPVGEVCRPGFAPETAESERPALLLSLVRAFEDYSATQGVGFCAVKDVPKPDLPLWSRCLQSGYQKIPSLPTAGLEISFDSLDGYLASLSRATRKDLRRKMKSREAIRVEWRHHIGDVLPQVLEIYRQTLARSEMKFEELTDAFFTGLLSDPQSQARCALYWQEAELVGFNLVLRDQTRLLDKFIGLKEEIGRSLNLYFLSWLTNLEFCLENRIAFYQAGQAENATKARLGCDFIANYLLFRHRQPVLNGVLKLVGSLVRVDRHDAVTADLHDGDAA